MVPESWKRLNPVRLDALWRQKYVLLPRPYKAERPRPPAAPSESADPLAQKPRVQSPRFPESYLGVSG